MRHISTQKSVLRGALHSIYDSYICQNKLHIYIIPLLILYSQN